jgi:hypothetical protein
VRDKIQTQVYQWYQDGDTEVFVISDRIDHLAHKLFQDYEPAIGPKPSFAQRLEKWLDNTDDREIQKTLFKLVPWLFYIGKNEFETLYRCAYNVNCLQWLIDIRNLEIGTQLNTRLEEATKKTWFCPITDSMRINQFYHLNGIHSADKRPDWRSLSSFGSTERIRDYISESKFEQVVLLEDFVGSGSQIKDHIIYAASTFTDLSFLIVPIVMCPHARVITDEIEAKYSNISVRPVLELKEDTFLRHPKEANADAFLKLVYDIAANTHDRMREAGFRYPFLGYRKTGGLIVLQTNTPNNSLPIVWSDSNWSPLFNRHVR